MLIGLMASVGADGVPMLGADCGVNAEPQWAVVRYISNEI